MTDTIDLRPHIRKHLEAGDKSGGVQLQDGRQVVIYTADAEGETPIHGTIIGNGSATGWDEYGKPDVYGRNSGIFLIPRPAPKRRVKGWVNVYPDGETLLYAARQEADEYANPNRIACIEIDVEEGHGL